MERMQQRMGGVWEKARYVMYGLVAGLFFGMILGWIFHNVVGTLFWVLLILGPIVLALLFYQRVTSRNRYERERVVVRTPDSDRVLVTREEPDPETIRDAEWRDPA